MREQRWNRRPSPTPHCPGTCARNAGESRHWNSHPSRELVPEGMHVFFQSENGLIGTGTPPEEGMAHPTLTDAGGHPVTALPGACTFDSAMSFGLIRGGHLDLTVLGGLQVDQEGHLANWMIPGKMVPGMGGAMDLVTGAKRVIVAMQHTAKGSSKLVKECRLPITSSRTVDLLVTELAVIHSAMVRRHCSKQVLACPSIRFFSRLKRDSPSQSKFRR